MKALHEGIRRFQGTVFPAMAERFQELASGQQPATLFIACSDSRVDPSLITQAGPGELFVIRNAGNLVLPWGNDPASDATIEFAVAILGVEHVVVCGHSGCGAVQGAMAADDLDHVPSVQAWVRHIEPAVRATGHLEGDERVREAVAANVRAQLDQLLTHPSVSEAVAGGELALHGWVYDIPTGEVRDITGADEPSVQDRA